MALTPQEMEVLQALIAKHQEDPLPQTESPVGDQLDTRNDPKDLPQYEAPVGQRLDKSRDAPPSDLYNNQAAQYNLKANQLETEADTPAPTPVGFKQRAVEAARAALENFGRLGAPGGYYGQQAARDKAAEDEKNAKVKRAQELRTQAQQQQDAGSLADYRVKEADIQDRNATVAEGNLGVNQKDYQLKEDMSNRPVRVNETTGSESSAVDPRTQKQIPGTTITGPARPEPQTKLPTKTIDVSGGKGTKMEIWSYDPIGGALIAKVADAAPPGAGNSGGGNPSVQKITGPNGEESVVVVNPRAATARPVTMEGDKTKTPVIGPTQATTNIRTDAAEQKAFKNLNDSYKVIQGLVAESRKDPNSAFLNDNAMVDQFFNIVKPDSGARMNQAYINNLLTPGPAADKLWAFLQKATTGAQLTQADREYMVNAARIVIEAKQPKPKAGAAPAPAAPAPAAPPAGGGGAIDALRKKYGG
jgi:hypothetical protein